MTPAELTMSGGARETVIVATSRTPLAKSHRGSSNVLDKTTREKSAKKMCAWIATNAPGRTMP